MLELVAKRLSYFPFPFSDLTKVAKKKHSKTKGFWCAKNSENFWAFSGAEWDEANRRRPSDWNEHMAFYEVSRREIWERLCKSRTV